MNSTTTSFAESTEQGLEVLWKRLERVAAILAEIRAMRAKAEEQED